MRWMKEEFASFGEVREWSCPNRAGGLGLVYDQNESNWIVLVIPYYGDGEYGDVWETEFGDNEAAARERYETERSELRSVPNWEAQEEYDRLHGTVNGQDPRIVAWNEEFGNEY